MHRRLAGFHRWRLQPRLTPDVDDDGDDAALAYELEMRAIERQWIVRERAAVRAAASKAPRDADAFVAWFEQLEKHGPGQHDPLFRFLAQQASRAQMRWFLRQEMAGEAGFDDLVALTQVKMPQRAKLELARNYWDEMGQGHPGAMHGPMLDRLAAELEIEANGDVVWESLALANTMTTLAMHREYAYQSIGALGVIELTAPGRAKLVNEGLKRLGIDGAARRYFALHATLDVKHSAAWNREVLRPLVAAEPRCAPLVAEGALLRLTAGARCFERYRAELRPAATRAA